MSALKRQLGKLPMGADSDRAPRFAAHGLVVISSPESAFRIECEMQNLSRTGLLVTYMGRVERSLESGEMVQLTIDPVQGIFDLPIMCKAEMARMEKIELEDSVIWHIGLKFLE
jgi:hypothetical protein